MSTPGIKAAKHLIWAATALVLLALPAGMALGHDEIKGKGHSKGNPANPTAVMRAFMNEVRAPQTLSAVTNVSCVGGDAGGYPCLAVNLLAFLPLAEIGGDHLGSEGNDIWGWTDPLTDREYALVGRVYGTSFVDITDPVNPVYLGELFAHNRVGSSWRDIKVRANHAFVVSEASGHGMQVFDLTSLRGLGPAGADDELPPAAHYDGFGSAHNLVINEASGYAYAVGTNTCAGGLHMIDISDPLNPTGAGCFSGDGYTHDAQCVNYSGPDPDYANREICFAYNEDTITIVDVTDKANPLQISRTSYVGEEYTHQGWLSEGQDLVFLDDELDERRQGHNTKTRAWDVWDLDAPLLIDVFTNTTGAIDHNQYVRGDFIFQANYVAGLRVLEIVRDSAGDYALLHEVAHFDIDPTSDSDVFSGAWSNYPYFPSGTIVVSGIEQGLFVLSLDLPDEVLFVAPGDGATLGDTVAIEIFARDSDLAAGPPTAVTWSLDGGAQNGTSPGAAPNSYTAAWDTTEASDGAHSLSATLEDEAGNISTATINITVANVADAPPSVDSLLPDGSEPVSGKVTLSATVSDDGSVVGVEFFDDGEKIGDGTLAGADTWTLPWNTRKEAKRDHVIRAVATDNGGQSGERSVTLTVDGGGGAGGPGGGNGGPGGDKCFKNKEPLCP